MIHKFSLYGTNIVVDVYSGAVHVVDDVAYEVLNHYKSTDKAGIINLLSGRFDRAQVVEAIEELEELEAAGQLY
jgi:uncharacterized protein